MELAALLLFAIGVTVFLSLRKKEKQEVERRKKTKEDAQYREELIDDCLVRLEKLKQKANEVDPQIGAKIVRTMMHEDQKVTRK